MSDKSNDTNQPEGAQAENLDGSAEAASPSPSGSNTISEHGLREMNRKLAEWRRKTTFNDGAHPKCPYCKFEQQDISASSVAGDLSFWHGDDGIEEEEMDCEKCERPFKLTCNFTVEWEATMTDEEFAIEEAKRPDPNQMSLLSSVAKPAASAEQPPSEVSQ